MEKGESEVRAIRGPYHVAAAVTKNVPAPTLDECLAVMESEF